MNTTTSQAARFASVGGLATLIHVSAAYLLAYLAEPKPLMANAFGFLCAFLLTYLGNYYWTFSGLGAHHRSFARFTIMAALAFASSTAIVFAGTTVLGWPLRCFAWPWRCRR